MSVFFSFWRPLPTQPPNASKSHPPCSSNGGDPQIELDVSRLHNSTGREEQDQRASSPSVSPLNEAPKLSIVVPPVSFVETVASEHDGKAFAKYACDAGIGDQLCNMSGPRNDSDEIAAEVPLPASPTPTSITTANVRLKDWERTRRSALETAKATVLAIERRKHAGNLRVQFVDAVRSFQGRIAQTISLLNPSEANNLALDEIQDLLDTSTAADAEVEVADTLLAEKEYELSRLTEAVFEDESAAGSLFDVLHAGGIDIRAADELSIASIYSDDAVDLVTLDDTADRVASKTDQINVLEDLFTRIHSEIRSTTNDPNGSKVAVLQEREQAVQREIAIAYSEREQLRALSETPLDLDAILGSQPPD